MKKILLILVIAIFANVVYSQQAAPEQIYQMNEDALKMVLEYKAQASMNKPRRFVRLFENEDIQIYNDLLGLSTEKTLSVKDYATLMEKEALYPTIKIQNLKKESIYRKNGKWMMDLSFEKELTYTDKCGVLFSTEEYYGQYHIITMTLAWNNDFKTCLIAKLEGKNNSRVGELNNYKVIVSSSNEKDKKRENNVLVNGKHLKFNSFGQYIISANAELVYEKDQDMKFELVQNESGCEIYSIKYDPMSMRIKPHYNLGAIMPYGKYFESGLLMSRAVYNEVGIDFGYVIPSMNRFQLGVYLGLGYAASGMRFSIDSLDFHYNAGAEADIDGDEYTRYYAMRDMTQRLKIKDLTVPLYVDFNVHINDRISVYADLGIKNYLNLTSSLSGVKGSYSTWGVYPQYSDLMLDHNTGLGQFVPEGTAFSAQLTTNKLAMRRYSMDLLTALGVRVKLKDEQFFPLYFDFSLGYQYSLLAPYKNKDFRVLPSGEVSVDEALVTYTTANGELITPFVDFVSNLRRKMFTFNFSIIYKF